jgi:hypothetical protein
LWHLPEFSCGSPEKMLIAFYESGNADELRLFLCKNCIDGMDFEKAHPNQGTKYIPEIITTPESV